MFFLPPDVLSNVHPLIKIIRPLFLLGRQRKKNRERRGDKEREKEKEKSKEKKKKNRKCGDKKLRVCICMYVCKKERIRTYVCACKYEVRIEDTKMVFYPHSKGYNISIDTYRKNKDLEFLF